MFESPIISYNSKDRKRRKLKYKYINSLKRKYEHLVGTQGGSKGSTKDTSGLPTPGNSAAEASDGDGREEDELSRLRRRKRRIRLQSILGHAADEDEDEAEAEGAVGSEDDDGYEDGYLDEKDPEKIFYSKYYVPEETYEVWTTSINNRIPIQRRSMSYHVFRTIEKYAHKKVAASLALSSKKLTGFFEVIRSGYETCPRERITNYQKVHLHHLVDLLYINILRGDFDTAYRCFSLLIRMNFVDLRSMWNLGSKILEHYNLDDQERFLEWMSTVLTSNSAFPQNSKNQLDPVFRSGSRTHIPNFVLSWLWLVLENAVKERVFSSGHDINWLLDKISELVLRPPYMDDAEVWFIYAMCYFIKADKLSLQLKQEGSLNGLKGSQLDIARNQVIENIHHVKNHLRICEEKGGFQYPKRVIEAQLVEFEKRLYPESSTHINYPGYETFPLEESDTEDNLVSINFLQDRFDAQVIQDFNVQQPIDEDGPFVEQPVHFGMGSDYSESE
ncbi:Rrn11p Ecym_3049 [Eremothecium cymbalariae DBVPG|uniref:RNA polymerase I-specific transcription initiation factor RRN11 n=1 Tax=Eremothecium cymbalariae (strain CBS 270.75 / DBVPG 7215 / KCTC 17166 / NRRL Y-17582) TaxID=931890 RepID=G8JQZ3_ERECY|nr:Hypothetical protein Ecym_3049 [Eremothecium cymbalariae DBVPG\